MILRGLLQCISITAFFSLRYVLDVLLTVPVVQALSDNLLIVVHWAWSVRIVFCRIARLFCRGSLDSECEFRARMMLRSCILRAVHNRAG